jgi:hypothetical protein
MIIVITVINTMIIMEQAYCLDLISYDVDACLCVIIVLAVSYSYLQHAMNVLHRIAL